MINLLIVRIRTWLVDYRENIVIMSCAVLFAIGLAFAWNWNQSNYVTIDQFTQLSSRIEKLENSQAKLPESTNQ